MNVYNIFRPHIVQFHNGQYAVRKFSLLWGWHYYDNQRYGRDNYWWTNKPKYVEWFAIPTLDKAQAVLDILRNPPLRVTKVYNAC